MLPWQLLQIVFTYYCLYAKVTWSCFTVAFYSKDQLRYWNLVLIFILELIFQHQNTQVICSGLMATLFILRWAVLHMSVRPSNPLYFLQTLPVYRLNHSIYILRFLFKANIKRCCQVIYAALYRVPYMESVVCRGLQSVGGTTRTMAYFYYLALGLTNW